jgi:uncharacterized damage-inducible protein DinB
MSAAQLETWAIHDRINRYLLEGIPNEALEAQSTSKGRTVAEQFAHIHNVRLMWLKSAAPDLLKALTKLEKENLNQTVLQAALDASGQAMTTLLEQAFNGDGKIKGFKPHASAFLGYLIAHEAHHRGQIVLTLKQAGHPVEKKIAFGLWEWGVR